MASNTFANRYCCDSLWGEVVGSKDPRRPTDVVVDRPGKRKLFEECEWRHWMSAGAPYGQGDFESRAKNFRFNKKSTCGLDRTKALYIDARRQVAIHI